MSSLDSAPRCQHVKIDGTPCGSPALADNPFCFFHARWKEQYVDFNQRPSAPAGIHLPVLEDAASIQVVLAQVMHLLLTDQIDNKKAGLLLYALQTASSNLARMPKPPEIKEEDPWAGEGPSTESLWTVLGIEPSEVLRVDKELKAEKAAKEAQEKANQYKMDAADPEPATIGTIKAHAVTQRKIRNKIGRARGRALVVKKSGISFRPPRTMYCKANAGRNSASCSTP